MGGNGDLQQIGSDDIAGLDLAQPRDNRVQRNVNNITHDPILA